VTVRSVSLRLILDARWWEMRVIGRSLEACFLFQRNLHFVRHTWKE
jgi:hypothetical protein